MRVSLKQVAAAGGVSITAASQILRREGRFATATRDRVLAVAAELGYRPDPVLSSLAARSFRQTQQTRGAGLVYITQLPKPYPYKRVRFHAEAKAVAESVGYRWQHVDLAAISDLRRRLRLWPTQGVRGLILGQEAVGLFLEEADCQLPVIFLGSLHPSRSFHLVQYDVERSVEMVWEQVLAAGYRRIGAAPMRHPVEISDDRVRLGLCTRHGALLPAVDRIPVCDAPFLDFEAFAAWYRRHRPEVVIGFNNLQLYYLQRLGVRVPDEVSFVSLNEEEDDQTVTGCFQSNTELARNAVVLVDTLIRAGDRGRPATPIRTLVSPQWIPGTTLRPRRPEPKGSG